MAIQAETSYLERRGRIGHYFDATAADAWARLTSDAPVSRIRATVRAGRDRMRALLLEGLPRDLRGVRILDAGCGTGAFAVAAAARGARVLAIDLSPTLIALARRRYAALRETEATPGGAITFVAGDMLDTGPNRFDHVVAMDSLIHYELDDVVRVAGALADRCERSLLFTFAPATTPLRAMHAVGRLFPRGNRAPAIVPIAPARLTRRLAAPEALGAFRMDWTERVASGFYTSQAMAWTRT